MSTRLQKAIGAVKDQTSISLAIVNGSSNLEVAIVRATTHNDDPIEERHIYDVLQLVSSNKIHAGACARAIGRRISRTRNWIVALKSLMLVLRIFQDGDPYFPREVLHAMKRGAKILNLSNFRDESHSSPWDYTAFVRTFALYLEQRLDCFLTGKLRQRYTCKERDGSHSYRTMANESLRDMKPSMLLDRIASWQRLLNRAIATRPTGSTKMNRLIQISLYVVVKESFDIYKDITEGLALILNNFFHLQYEACVCAFEISVMAVKQFEELNEFYSVCQTIGVGRISEYPNIQTISEESLERMEHFLEDQSSSSGHVRPPNKPLVVPDPEVRSPSSCDGSWQPNLDARSEFGTQCSSIEDLISATETGKRPSISIDLEAYSDQFEKTYQQEEPFRVSYTGSTQSLPVMNSMIDLLSLDDWPPEEQQEQEREQELFDTVILNDSTNPQHSTSSNDPLQSSLDKSWELVLAESVERLPQSRENSLDGFGNLQVHDTYSRRKQPESNEGWELALVGTPGPQQTHQGISSNTFDASTAITLYDQPPPQSPSLNHYNPFLDVIPATPPRRPSPTMDFGANFLGVNPFSSPPPFPRTTPSQNDPFSAGLRKTQSDRFALPPHQRQNDRFLVRSISSQNDPIPRSSFTPPAHGDQSDPFGPYIQIKDPFSERMNQQNLLKQQQLWLQHQQKIMDRNMANI
ncbi:clathrin coat assembly protein AP180-like [Cynara cardunculus var. scolymus]|uniref:AP180 N-terminal homology (ANTH) domain-containing protein n=1 Tax=Cynara cardunculus var. scolymus TaxID=59895 RepID=A0A103Y3Z3_CYNCS|nr:clathrin coat assembly protein AP180-like [Cynara cardunculus var. scolymus]KVI02049.1 AP180 N-terminal homology (ANTH) domain-containing protein [Cynara cardunculus var. scolymus]